jgi:hypothetical protein
MWRLAASGETVLITDRDRVFAEFAPPRAGRSESPPDAMLAEVASAERIAESARDMEKSTEGRSSALGAVLGAPGRASAERYCPLPFA